jgi:hypothetical protein
VDKLTAQLVVAKAQLGDANRTVLQLREKSAGHEEAHGRARAELLSTQRSHAELASQVQALEARALSQQLDADGDGVGGEAGESLSAAAFGGGGESLGSLGADGASSTLAGGAAGTLQMRERVKRLERENDRLERERSEAVRAADARVVNLQAQLSAARDSSVAHAASSGAAASTREAALVEEVALLKKSSGMDAGMKEKVSKKFMEQKKKIIEQTQRINNLESLKVENVRLAHEVQEKQEHLERRNAEQQKLEQYVKKALAHANQTVKASQLKYKKSLEIYRKQVCQAAGVRDLPS